MTEMPVDEFPVADGEPIITPDHTASREEKTKSSDRENILKNLGKNKTATGRVAKPRQLTESDIVKLEGWYHMMAMPMMAFNARAAHALMDNAGPCAAAWQELARENDGVRRAILAMLEGGAWGKVIMAHTPLMMCFMPRDMLDRFGFLEATANAEDDNAGD